MGRSGSLWLMSEVVVGIHMQKAFALACTLIAFTAADRVAFAQAGIKVTRQ
jgi:hypothetical protein